MAKYKVNIVGAGFVGLSVAEVLSHRNNVEKITLIDVDKDKIDRLKSGEIYIQEPDLELKSKKLRFTSNYDDADGDIFFVCVGTPNDEDRNQVSKYVEDAFKSISKVNKRATIILKSTTTPENVEKLRKYVDPLFGRYITSPEFMAEGKAVADLSNQDQLIVGADSKDREYATELLTTLFKGTYKELKETGLVEAMIAKYFINSYKASKLNFINEFAWYCRLRDFKFSEVINAAKDDPVMGVGFDIPGLGFGGSCFPKDLSAIADDILVCGHASKLNRDRIIALAMMVGMELEDGNIVLIGGKAFKNGTNDTRNSVGIKFAETLNKVNPNLRIYFYDLNPKLSDLTIEEVRSLKLGFDCVVIINELPELAEIFEDPELDVKLINTRKFD